MNKITNITILSNGNIAPNKVIDLGNQYESVGDIIRFDIPNAYHGYHYYLAFYMKKHDTILLPVNYSNGALDFIITTTVTRNSGTYEIVFLATERAVVDGDTEKARKVFVSTTMNGFVEDNPLENPVIDEVLDENLQVIYDELCDLRDEIIEDIETDYYRGATYVPDLSEDGILSFTRDDGKDISVPEPRNIMGPTGPYYKPSMDEEGVMHFDVQPSVPNTQPTEADTVNVLGMVKEVSDAYLEGNLEGIASDYLDAHLEGAVEEAVSEHFRWKWDDENQILYIYTNKDDTTGE